MIWIFKSFTPDGFNGILWPGSTLRSVKPCATFHHIPSWPTWRSSSTTSKWPFCVALVSAVVESPACNVTSARANNKRWSMDRWPKSAASIKAVHLVLFLSESDEPSLFTKVLCFRQTLEMTSWHGSRNNSSHLQTSSPFLIINLLQCRTVSSSQHHSHQIRRLHQATDGSHLPCLAARYPRSPTGLEGSLKFSSRMGQFHPLSLTFCIVLKIKSDSRHKNNTPLYNGDSTMPHKWYTMLIVSVNDIC